MRNLKEWHGRQVLPIQVASFPSNEQRDEIEWRVAIGLSLNVVTEGPCDAFHLSSVLLQGGSMEVMIIVPLWMWHRWIPKVIPVWGLRRTVAPGIYRHQSG